MGKMMKKNKREKRKSKFNAPIVVLVFTILLILFFVMAYMLFHSRSIASLEAEKSVIEKLYGCDGIRDYDYKKEDALDILLSEFSQGLSSYEEVGSLY